MISTISCKCPQCGAELKINKEFKVGYCNYCGSKILISNDNEFVHKYVDEAKIKQVEANERITNRRIDREEKKETQLRKMIVIYVITSLVMCFFSFICYEFSLGLFGSVIQFATAIVITLPIAIFLTRLILKYDETSTATYVNKRWFGLKTEITEDKNTPAKKVLLLWVIYLCILYMIYMFCFI